MPERSRRVSCPQCGKEMLWDTRNPWRPFCSERCKLIDLGQWASESYRIPETNQEPEHETQPDEKPER